MKDLESLHPDYSLDEVDAPKIAYQSPLFERLLNELIEEMGSDNRLSAEAWLATLLIGEKRCQVQLIVTAIDSHFVDEN